MKYNISLQEYYNNYKKIFKTVTLNGDILPYDLYMINVPDEYDFSLDERRKLFNKISVTNKVKIEEAFKDRRVNEVTVFHKYKSKKKIDNVLTEFHNSEMDTFFDKYNEFKNIMVEKEEIDKILSDIINNISTKCHHTIAEMQTTLSSMGYDEQYQQLKEKNLLNPLEIEDFRNQVNALKRNTDSLSDVESQYDPNEEDIFGLKDSIARYKKNIEEAENELFQYGRRLIEGLKTNPVPDINKTDFVEDEQWGGRNGHNFEWDSQTGVLEQRQIDAQKNSVNVDPNDLSMINIGSESNPIMVAGRMNDNRLLAMDNYFNGDTQQINYTISHEGYIKSLNNEQRKQMKDIDSLMKESPGLLQDTILYRAGYFNIHLNPGDHASFKGYQSTSFQRESSNVYMGESLDSNTMMFVIHAPQGTKGIVGNDDRFENGTWEHEYVLPRNTGYTVLSIDYDNMVCEVVLDG